MTTFKQAAEEDDGDWCISLLNLDRSSLFGFSKEIDLADQYEENIIKYGDLQFFDVSKDSLPEANGKKIQSACRESLDNGDEAIVVGWKYWQIKA